MLDATLKSQLKDYLTRLQQPIDLVAAYGNETSGDELRQLLQDIQECSPLVRLRESKYASRSPSFGIARAGEPPRIEFAGLPLGHEFTSLVLALLQVGGHPSKEDPELQQAVSRLQEPMHFEVFMSLSCHNCPEVVQALNLMATLNPRISSTVIEGGAFQDEVARRNVLAVPAVFLNGEPFGSGRMSLAEVVAKVDAEAGASRAQHLSEKEPFDVLVVGGGPAGAAAAVYAARKGIRTGLVAERFGGQTNDTLAIENYISVPQTTGPRFASDLLAHAQQYGVDIMTPHRVDRLAPAATEGGLAQVFLQSGGVLRARSVVVATGARWRNVNVPGEQEYRNKGVAYCPHCDGPLFKNKRVAVIGGGNSGVEAAIDLAGLASHVTVLEFGEQLRADAVLVARLRSLPNVTVLTQAQTTEILGDGQKVSGLQYRDRGTGESLQLGLEGVFVQIGLVPNTEALREALALAPTGEIEVDARCHTSAPGVFAAGDATVVPYKQIVVAAGEGAKAALSAFDYLIRTAAAA